MCFWAVEFISVIDSSKSFASGILEAGIDLFDA